jgi:hypothetical protein
MPADGIGHELCTVDDTGHRWMAANSTTGLRISQRLAGVVDLGGAAPPRLR